MIDASSVVATAARRGRTIATGVVMLVAAWAPVVASQGPAPQRPIPGTFRSDRLGLEYRLHPYRGHYGARLTRPPEPGSPLLAIRRPNGDQTYLEPGDMIVTLDDQIIDGPDDVENHILQTKITFVNVRTGLPERATAMFPNVATAGPGPAPGPAPRPDPGPAPVPGPAVQPGESRRVRALIVIDTETGLAALRSSQMIVEQMLEPLRAEGRCEITLLRGPDATARGLVEAIRSIGDASSDTVFIYYTGHGATDLGKGHTLTFALGPALPRSEIRQELAALRPRLGILLTECCSILDVIPPAKASPAPQGIEPPPDDHVRSTRSLLLRTRGIVDINSSSFEPSEGLNEYSFLGDGGGLFTGALGDVLVRAPFAKLDDNHDGLLTWGEFFPFVRVLVKVRYLDMRINTMKAADQAPRSVPKGAEAMLETIVKQRVQTPQAFALDGPTFLILTGPRFDPGATFSSRKVVDPQAGGEVAGARVDAITDPAVAFGKTLKVGDVVTAVNGRRFPTPALMLERLDAIAPLNQIRYWHPADSAFHEAALADAPLSGDDGPGPGPAPASAPEAPAAPAAPAPAEVRSPAALTPLDREEQDDRRDR